MRDRFLESRDTLSVAVSGGPCGGKTDLLNGLKQAFHELGHRVLLVSEIATELHAGGYRFLGPAFATDSTRSTASLVDLQIIKEAAFFENARHFQRVLPTIVLVDRCVVDGAAFAEPAAWKEILEARGLTHADVVGGYSVVVHMTSTAKGAPEVYKRELANNPARWESLEEATHQDDRLLAAWQEHPTLIVIDNASCKSGKEKRDEAIAKTLAACQEKWWPERSRQTAGHKQTLAL